VVECNTGETLLATNPQYCLVPASVQKLLTSAAALEILGGNFQFKTLLCANGKMENRKLSGDVIISGGGDPSLGSGYFSIEKEKPAFLSVWISMIQTAGIDTIDGTIIADPHCFSDIDVPPSWLWEDLGNYYGAAASGINVFDNTFSIEFQTPVENDKPTEIINIQPEIPKLILKNEVVSSAEQKDGTTVFGNANNNVRLIRGTLPSGKSSYPIKASIPNPALLTAYQLKESLSDSGIVVTGEAKVSQKQIPTDRLQIMGVWSSPALSQIVEKMNHESSNLYAEAILKQIALTQKGEGTSEKGTEALMDFWKSKGINGTLKLADGSGLSRQNTLTAQTLTDLLVFMKNNSRWYEEFFQSIPVTGMDGTQKYYFQDSFLKGKLRAKSGSMKGVRSFAGYMTTQKGTEIAFCVIVNHFECGSFEMASKLEKLIEEIYLVY